MSIMRLDRVRTDVGILVETFLLLSIQSKTKFNILEIEHLKTDTLVNLPPISKVYLCVCVWLGVFVWWLLEET